MRVLVTGGAGFIGSHFVRMLLHRLPDVEVINLDKLTYAGNLANLEDVTQDPRHRFVRGDVADARLVNGLFRRGLDAVVHFAAETHVDRSILDGRPFVRTNVVGTQTLLEAALRHGIQRFIQVSTDEVYGPAPPGVRFSEDSPPNPTSPYAASKAAADLLCLAYRKTYGVPVVVTRCTNNYGPYQFPEKFIPLVITHALQDRPIPIYGDGRQERDWLYVEDHCEGLLQVLLHPDPRPVLNFASGCTVPNLQVARTILRLLRKPESLLQHVRDRPAHDRRYALATHRARAYLNWKPRVGLEEGLERTVAWYRENRAWWEAVKSGAYRAYYETWYGKVLQAVGGR
ncbi:MAG: dTDP-glucose 4,6-dehydratase [Armatimonadetes bacterium]|nr:dTDP-glucose 4,6-dehydratase [Armatimonadota bacterium]MDW8153900.1 dTDP-glucose 4,6-dehydratase [Armatimonadota bacterium]